MKKLIILAAMGLFLSGCGTAVERSEFWKHNSHYRSFEHLWFSWTGYKTPTQETFDQSQNQEWWGMPIPEEK